MGATTTDVTMGFVKAVKNKAYSKRYQVKYKRRREGKTDYYARKRLVANAKNKYGSPKYRFVVRFTRKDIICQVVSSKIKGDITHCAAYAHELPRYGVKVGLTNYSAAYCVGLLCARRLLKKYGLDAKFVGTEEVTAEFEDAFVQNEDDDDERNAFHALLDVGLKPTTLGSKIFSAMKGAFDGGLEIPHSNKKFYGFDADEGEYDAEAHKERILGGHVSGYMEALEEEEPEEFAKKFSKFVEAGIKADGVADMYLACHKAIRANPEHVPTEKKVPKDLTLVKREGGIRYTNAEGKECFINRAKRSNKQRKNRVAQKKAAVLAKLASGDDDEEDDEDEE